MFEVALGQGSIEFKPRGPVGQLAVGAFAEPDHEAAFLCHGSEREFGVAYLEPDLLATPFPAEVFDKEFAELSGLQQRTGAVEIEWHWGLVVLVLALRSGGRGVTYK